MYMCVCGLLGTAVITYNPFEKCDYIQYNCQLCSLHQHAGKVLTMQNPGMLYSICILLVVKLTLGAVSSSRNKPCCHWQLMVSSRWGWVVWDKSPHFLKRGFNTQQYVTDTCNEPGAIIQLTSWYHQSVLLPWLSHPFRHTFLHQIYWKQRPQEPLILTFKPTPQFWLYNLYI